MNPAEVHRMLGVLTVAGTAMGAIIGGTIWGSSPIILGGSSMTGALAGMLYWRLWAGGLQLNETTDTDADLEREEA